eukprot:TRINITY_DN7019_c0_g1_i1.p1 TRINITY_DN7019_c0_g1~~TRINITY_DN7019_c0_g1_i1.p1  ORF type:complete len:590 (-),score=135.17 TRINITY_DN7019_c0_g1_i1:61-1830(-)
MMDITNDPYLERNEDHTESSDDEQVEGHEQQQPQMKEKKKGKSSPKRTLMKSRCSCCHICRTSLKNYPRDAMPCSTCNAVVCKTCFRKRMNETWEDAQARKDTWICPICDRTCSCARCLRYANYTTNEASWNSSTRPISNAIVGPRRKDENPEDLPAAPPTVVWKYGDTVSDVPPTNPVLPKRKAKKEGSATPKKYGKQKGNSSVPHSPSGSHSEESDSDSESESGSSVEEEERAYQKGIKERRSMEAIERRANKERITRQHSNERYDRTGKAWKQPKSLRYSLDSHHSRSNVPLEYNVIDGSQYPLQGDLRHPNFQINNNNNPNFGSRTCSGPPPGRPNPAAAYRVVNPDYPYNEKITRNFLNNYQSGYVKNQHFDDNTTGQDTTESSSTASPSTPLTPTPNYTSNSDISDLLPSSVFSGEEQMLLSELYLLYPDNFVEMSKAMGGSKTPEALSLYFNQKKAKEEFKNSAEFGFSLSNSQALSNSQSIGMPPPPNQSAQVSTSSFSEGVEGANDCESSECDSSQCCCALRIPTNETIEKLSKSSSSSSCPILSDVIENYNKYATPQPPNLLKLWSNLCLQCEMAKGPS